MKKFSQFTKEASRKKSKFKMPDDIADYNEKTHDADLGQDAFDVTNAANG
jgi:hypothetical protein